MSDVVYVVINADDLGLHPAVLRGVLRGHRAGIITSASLLSNSPYTEAAVEGTRAADALSIGVHLNVLRGKPLLPADEVASLVGHDGRFLGSASKFAARYLRGAILTTEVEREWAAQIERALALGLRPSHLDSEKHSHCLPGLFDRACTLAARYGIKWVRRISERVPSARWDASALRARLLNAGQRLAQSSSVPRDGRFADRVWGIAHVGSQLDLDEFRRTCADGVRGVVEIICHPGEPRLDDPPLPEFGPMRAPLHWKTELEHLLGPAGERLRTDSRFRLVSFSDPELNSAGEMA